MSNRYLNWYVIFILSFFSINEVGAQSLEINVVDSLSQLPLEFVSIGKSNSKEQWLTNAEGFVRIPCQQMDTITFQYIGYKDYIFVVNIGISKTTKINLQTDIMLLSELTITSDDDFLYKLLDKLLTNIKHHKPLNGKSFMQLETDIDSEPRELVQAFYNAEVDQFKLQSTILKNGRIGVKDDYGKYFTTFSTSQALCALDIFKNSLSYPKSPFVNLRKTKRNYVISTSYGSSKHTIIHLEPKSDRNKNWTSDIWFEKENMSVEKIELNVRNSFTKPFLPIQANSKIDSLNLFIQIHLENNTPTLFNIKYDFKHIGESDTLNVSSNGYFHIFEKDSAFITPYYKDIENFDDYRKISIIPYNEMFWNCTHLPDFTESQFKKLKYFEENGVVLNFKAFDKRSVPNSIKPIDKLFEHNNLVWCEKDRWILKPKMINESDVKTNEIVRRHSLVPQIILDVNICNDSLVCKTVTILDVFKSTYNLPHESTYFRFFNIYFDLCEIERRKLQQKLEKVRSVQEVDDIYKESLKNLDKTLKEYKNEVSSGENFTAILKWNEYIEETIGIDNFGYFPLK